MSNGYYNYNGSPSPGPGPGTPGPRPPRGDIWETVSWALGVGLILAGAACLAAWVLVLALRPEAAEAVQASSMVTIDGGGVLLGLCALAVVCGAALLLRKK